MRLVCRATGTEAVPHHWAAGCLSCVAKALLVCPSYLLVRLAPLWQTRWEVHHTSLECAMSFCVQDNYYKFLQILLLVLQCQETDTSQSA